MRADTSRRRFLKGVTAAGSLLAGRTVLLDAGAAFAVAGLAQWVSTGLWFAGMLAARSNQAMPWYMLPFCLAYLAEIAVCLYFLKRPGWLVSFAYPEGEPDENA